MATVLSVVAGDGLSAGEELNDKDREWILRHRGLLVTEDKASAFYLPSDLRSLVGLLPDGTILVSRAHRAHMIVSDLKNRRRTAGLSSSAIKIVELSFLEELKSREDSIIADRTHFQKVLFDYIKAAALRRVSDIHITIAEKSARIDWTVQGDFVRWLEIKVEEARSLVLAAFHACKSGDKQFQWLKAIAARLDTSDNFAMPEGVQALRLQFTPGDNNSHRTVARILYSDSTKALADIDVLGYRPSHIASLRAMRRQPHGIILISGPTGHGKSTTMKTALEKTWEERGGRVNMLTIEDPPEYHIKGAFQIEVMAGVGDDERRQGFKDAMRSVLRMAPNICMVGEIKDEVFASLTIDLAKTGHLVWSSIHSNSAIEIIGRLAKMAVSEADLCDPHLIRGLIGQRLVKTVCGTCAVSYDEALRLKGEASPAVFFDSPEGEFYQALDMTSSSRIRFARNGGCKECNDASLRSGHCGRRVVAEVIMPSRDILELAYAGRSDKAEIKALQQHGALSMLEHALLRVLCGECDPRDVGVMVGDVCRELRPGRLERILESSRSDRHVVHAA